MTSSPPSHRPGVLFAAFVLVALSIPLPLALVDVLGGPDRARDEFFAPTPPVPDSLGSLARFPGWFLRYFEKRFGLREPLTRAHALLSVKLLDMSPTPSVLRGADEFLFLGSDSIRELYRPGHALTSSELRAMTQTLQQRADWLRARGIDYLLVIAPDKQSIYGQHLPPIERPGDGPTRTDQLCEHVRANTTLRVVDLRPTLREAAKRMRVYHKTDTHWNAVGAYLGSVAVLQALGLHASGNEHGVELPKHVTRRWAPPGDLARMMGLRQDMHEELLEPRSELGPVLRDSGEPLEMHTLDEPEESTTELRGDAASRARLVVLHDSFGIAMRPYLAAPFARSVFHIDYGLDEALITRERPTVVIQQVVERRMTALLPEQH